SFLLKKRPERSQHLVVNGFLLRTWRNTACICSRCVALSREPACSQPASGRKALPRYDARAWPAEWEHRTQSCWHAVHLSSKQCHFLPMEHLLALSLHKQLCILE